MAGCPGGSSVTADFVSSKLSSRSSAVYFRDTMDENGQVGYERGWCAAGSAVWPGRAAPDRGAQRVVGYPESSKSHRDGQAVGEPSQGPGLLRGRGVLAVAEAVACGGQRLPDGLVLGVLQRQAIRKRIGVRGDQVAEIGIEVAVSDRRESMSERVAVRWCQASVEVLAVLIAEPSKCGDPGQYLVADLVFLPRGGGP